MTRIDHTAAVEQQLLCSLVPKIEIFSVNAGSISHTENTVTNHIKHLTIKCILLTCAASQPHCRYLGSWVNLHMYQ